MTRALFPHQVKAVCYMGLHDKGGLFLDPGTGKTLISIRGLSINDLSLKDNKTLIICPASLRKNWHHELTLEGCSELRYSVRSYEWLVKNVSSVVNEKVFTNVIFDESHYLKNVLAKRTKASYLVAKMCKRAWFLTGSPFLNCSSDIYMFLKSMLGSDILPYSEFCEKYCKLVQNKWTGEYEFKGYKNSGSLKKILRQHSLRMKKADVVKDLPPLIEGVFFVDGGHVGLEFEKNAAKLYEKKNDPHIAEIRQLVAFSKMRSYVESLNDRGIKEGLIFCWHKEVAKKLAGMLPNSGLATGDEKITERIRNIDGFQDKALDWLICTISATGVGFNIQRAEFISYFEMPWTWGETDQGISRAHRIGNKGVRVEYVLLKDSIDEVIYKIVMDKRSDATNLTNYKEKLNAKAQ